MKPKKLNVQYKSYIKTLPCLVCGNPEVDPHHLESLGMGGKNKDGKKDFSCIPLCRKHHSELEQIGKSKFEEKHEIDLWWEALKLLISWFAEKHRINLCKVAFKLLREFILSCEQ